MPDRFGSGKQIDSPWTDWLQTKRVAEIDREMPTAQPGKQLLEWSDKTIADYRAMLDAFAGVTMLPASYEKRFIRSMRGLGDGAHLTVKQCRLIESLYHRYRRQIPDHEKLCMVCGKGKPNNEKHS